MAKEISGYIKLQIMGGQANPAPPVGPALGQRGINIMEFVKLLMIRQKHLLENQFQLLLQFIKIKNLILKLNHHQHLTLLKKLLN